MSEPRLCGATTKEDGTPCRRPVGPGFTRCSLHGGHSPLARQAAAETLASAALPAARVLFEIIDQWQQTRCPVCGMPSGDPSPVIRAAQIVLDRTGFGATSTMQFAPAPTNALEHLTTDELVARAEQLADSARAMRDQEREPALLEAATDGYVIEDSVGDVPPEDAEAVGSIPERDATITVAKSLTDKDNDD